MADPLVTMLLPALAHRSEPVFNVFDVMRHGTHEKQLSNVFAWLLDSEGSHHLGGRFQQILVSAVNRAHARADEVRTGSFSVRQEVNVSPPGNPVDIADLVLEDDETVLVVENYYTSDGHGHCYADYLAFGARAGKHSVVVMLCAGIDKALLADRWDEAVVVSYPDLIVPLLNWVDSDPDYRRSHPDQVTFFRHLHRRFVKDSSVNDNHMIRFVEAMCATGEAKHYRTRDAEVAALGFADALREQAVEHFGESRAWLQRVKAALRSYARRSLLPQLTQALGPGVIDDANANYSGIYQWTVNFWSTSQRAGEEALLQLKFGPSAWFANEVDERRWKVVSEPDYSRVFLTRPQASEVRQSDVTLLEVLAGLSADDHRLRDELLDLRRSPNHWRG